MAASVRTRVVSEEEACRLLDGEHKFTHLVSIGSADCEMTPPFYERFQGGKLRLLFDDVNLPSGWATIRAGYVPPSLEDVQRLIHFFQLVLETAHPNVLIHCGQGISRSGAAALILHYMSERNWMATAEVMYRDHPWVEPNRTMLMWADKILGGKEVLFQAEGWLMSLQRAGKGTYYSG